MRIKATRYHDFSMGHRVCEHEGKCAMLHGHNYRIHFYCEGEQLDLLGRVIDFSVIKERLCNWLEDNWDHRFMMWSKDPKMPMVRNADPSLVEVEFNPTAENMGEFLLSVVAPAQLIGTGVVCTKVVIEETRKCSVEVILK